MATAIGTYNSNSSSSTKMAVSWEAISATTIRISTIYTLGSATSLGTGNSRALYVNIYNSGGGLLGSNSIEVKSSSITWNANGTYYGSVDVNIPYQSGVNLLVTAYTSSTGGGITSCLWNATANVNYPSQASISYPVFNTAPYWSGGWSLLSRVTFIPENANNITISWGGAYDLDGNTLYYTVYREASFATTEIVTNTTATSFVDNTIPLNQYGHTIRYRITVNDGLAYASNGSIYSDTVTVNSLTAGIISHTGDIDWLASGKQDIAFTLTAGNNLDGSAISYVLSISGLTITNPIVTGNFTLSIYRSGTVPTNPYITWTNLKTYLASGNYQGTIPLILTTSNTYGTSKTNINNIVADIRTTPTWTTPSFLWSGWYNINGTVRYLPDVSGINLDWADATDDLGTAITYSVEYKLSTDANWITLITGLTTSQLLNFRPSSASTQIFYNVRVIAKTVYNTTTTQNAPTIPIDKYLRPLFSLIAKTRTTTTVGIDLSVTPRTSIPSIDYTIAVLSYTNVSGGTVSLLPSTDWTPSFVYTDGGVLFTQTSSYTMVCKFNDSIGAVLGGAYATALSLDIPVASYVPMFSIRKKGVGIGIINDGSDSKILKVVGASKFTGATSIIGSTDITGTLNVTSTSSLYASSLTLGASNYFVNTGDGVLKQKSLANVKAEILTIPTLIEPTLLSGITNWDVNADIRAGYYKMGGRVYLQGTLRLNSAVAPCSIFTLPVGYRPVKAEYFACVTNNNMYSLRVGDDGNVYNTNGNNLWISLSGVSFRHV